VVLRLKIDNTNLSKRSQGKVRRAIEKQCLSRYGMQKLKGEEYQVFVPYEDEQDLEWQTEHNNQPTVRNIRLWDYHPLLSTYKQLQEIRLYYKLTDVDRYTLNNNYQQVMLSARELSYAQLPQEAQTWVNQRFKYTHGHESGKNQGRFR
jgi:uncharacterized membrane protein (UPF0182 family)